MWLAPSPGKRWGIDAAGTIDPRTGQVAPVNPDFARPLIGYVKANTSIDSSMWESTSLHASTIVASSVAEHAGSGADQNPSSKGHVEDADSDTKPVVTPFPQDVHCKLSGTGVCAQCSVCAFVSCVVVVCTPTDTIRQLRDPVATYKARNTYGFEPLRQDLDDPLSDGEEPDHVQRARAELDAAVRKKRPYDPAASRGDASSGPAGFPDRLESRASGAANVPSDTPKSSVPSNYSAKFSNFGQHMRRRERHLQQPAEKALALLPSVRDRLMAEAAKTLSPAAIAERGERKPKGRLPNGAFAQPTPALRATRQGRAHRRPADSKHTSGGEVSKSNVSTTGKHSSTKRTERRPDGGSAPSEHVPRTSRASAQPRSRTIPELPAAGAVAAKPQTSRVRPFRTRAQAPLLVSGLGSVELDAVPTSPTKRVQAHRSSSSRTLMHFSRSASTGVLMSPVNTSHLPHSLAFSQTVSKDQLFATLGYKRQGSAVTRQTQAPNGGTFRLGRSASSRLHRDVSARGTPTAGLRASSLRAALGSSRSSSQVR